VRQRDRIRPADVEPAIEVRHHAAAVQIGLERPELQPAHAEGGVALAPIALRWAAARHIWDQPFIAALIAATPPPDFAAVMILASRAASPSSAVFIASILSTGTTIPPSRSSSLPSPLSFSLPPPLTS